MKKNLDNNIQFKNVKDKDAATDIVIKFKKRKTIKKKVVMQ
jgi:hypothetical protein